MTVPFDLKSIGQEPTKKPAKKPDEPFDIASAFDLATLEDPAPAPLRLKPVVVSRPATVVAVEATPPGTNRVSATIRDAYLGIQRPIEEVGRGLIRGLAGTGLSSTGEVLEGVGGLTHGMTPIIAGAPGAFAKSIEDFQAAQRADTSEYVPPPVAGTLKRAGQSITDAMRPRVDMFANVGAPRQLADGSVRPASTAEKAGDFLNYAGSATGELLGTTIPSALAYMAGGAPAAGASSYVINTGDIRGELSDLGVNGTKREAVAFITGVPVAALDAFGLDFWAAALKKRIAQMAAKGAVQSTGASLVREVLTEGLKVGGRAALAEVPTEDLQEAIQAIAVNAAAGRPLTTGLKDRIAETTIQVALGSFVSGGFAGGTTAAARRLRRPGEATAAPAPAAAPAPTAPAPSAEPLDLDTVLTPDAVETPVKQPSASTTVSMEPVPITEPTARAKEVRDQLAADLERTVTQRPTPPAVEAVPDAAAVPAPTPQPAPVAQPQAVPVAATEAKPAEPSARPYPVEKAQYTPEETETRQIVRGLDAGRPGAIDRASQEMAKRVPKNAVLVPVPNAEGKTENNKALANAIASYGEKVTVADVLKRNAPVESNETKRAAGQPGLSASDQAASIAASRNLPKKATGPVFLVDATETTGATMHGARVALGRADATGLTFAKRQIPQGENAVTRADTEAAIADKVRRAKNRYSQHGDVGSLLMDLASEQRRIEGETDKFGRSHWARENEYGQVVAGSSMSGGRNKKQAQFTGQRIKEIEEQLRHLGVHQEDIDAARSDPDLAIEVAARVSPESGAADDTFDVASLDAEDDFVMSLGSRPATAAAAKKPSSDQTDESTATRPDAGRSADLAERGTTEGDERQPGEGAGGRPESGSVDDATRNADAEKDDSRAGDRAPQRGVESSDEGEADWTKQEPNRRTEAGDGDPRSDAELALRYEELDERLAGIKKSIDSTYREKERGLLRREQQKIDAEQETLAKIIEGRVEARNKASDREGGRRAQAEANQRIAAKRYVPAGVDVVAAMAYPKVTKFDTPLIKAARQYTADREPTRTIATPERETLRKEALARELERVKATAVREHGELGHTREMGMILGLPGSGKTTAVVDPLAKFLKAGISDIDDHKKAFPEYEQGWGSEVVYQEAGVHVGAPLRDQLQAEGANYVTSGVGTNTASYLKSLDDLHKQGYRVHLVHVATGHDVAKRRVVKRFEEGGHFIRPEYIDFIGSSDRETFEAAKSHPAVAGHVRFESVEGGRPKLIEQRGAEAWLKAAGYEVAEGTERGAGAGEGRAAVGAAPKGEVAGEKPNGETRQVRPGVGGQPEGVAQRDVREPSGEGRARADGAVDRRAGEEPVSDAGGATEGAESAPTGTERATRRAERNRESGERDGDGGSAGEGRGDGTGAERRILRPPRAAKSAATQAPDLFDLSALDAELAPLDKARPVEDADATVEADESAGEETPTLKASARVPRHPNDVREIAKQIAEFEKKYPGSKPPPRDEDEQESDRQFAAFRDEKIAEAVHAAEAKQKQDKAEPTKLGLLVSGSNYSLPVGTDPYAGGQVTKARDNIAAIRLLKEIEAAGRQATEAEQQVLAKYAGWGGMAQFLDKGHKLYESPVGAEIRSLLTEEEFRAAAASTPNAHYTTPEVARAMHDLLRSIGFSEGRILEPAMGSGIFVATAPPLTKLEWTGVELDPITARISKLLYPRADVHVAGFETLVRPDGYFDAAIGNVPFGNYQVADPRYDKLKLSIHDYFFAKTLDLVRPGGVMAFITSRFTMDRQDTKVRQYMSDRADLIGAIRLPSNAFAKSAKTTVVTDIIVLRRREDGTPATGPAWVRRESIEIAPKSFFPVNEYFVEHPEMILGEQGLTGSMYREDTYTVTAPKGQDMHLAITQASSKLHEQFGTYEARKPDAPGTREPIQATGLVADTGTKEGAFVVGPDGGILVREKGILVPASVPKTQTERVRKLVALRDAAREVLTTQLTGASDAVIDAALKKANRLYDGFVATNGPINLEQRIETSRKDAAGNPVVQMRFPNLAAFSDDPDWSLVAALEEYDRETGKATKADMLTKRVLAPPSRPEKVDTPVDALPIVLAERGEIDLPAIAKLAGTSEEDAAKLLAGKIFENPDGGEWETAAKYLSGNVRAKLDKARQAAKKDDRFKANVAALEGAQPADLPPSKISGKLGAPWIPTNDVAAFADELLGEQGTRVVYVRFDATWRVTAPPGAKFAYAATNEFGTARAHAYELLEDALNLRATEITDPVPGDPKKRVRNPQETLAAQEKQQAIKDRFEKWLWSDVARGDRLSRYYNDHFNNIRLLESDGAHLTLPGAASHINGKPFALRPHQKDAIWRILEWGNTLLAHVVGAGKTYTMVAAAMEEKRLGLVRKPMFVVPNHMLEQWTREFKQLYPTANLLIATKRDFAKADRQAFVARAAANDWDAIIMTHRSFESVPMSDAFQKEYVEREVDELESAIREAKAEKADRSLIKEIEKAKKRREAKLKELSAGEKKDQNLTFEEMGVDKLYVDEAHMYKNLEFMTKMRGVSAPASQRAFDMFLKTQYLHRTNPGRGVAFATGTPISNTMAEMFTMTRYLAPELLDQRGIAAFDAWAATFGELVTGLEIAPDGSGARLKTRFAKYQNVGELIQIFRSFADVQSADDLKLPRPDLRDGKMQMVSAKSTPELKMYVRDLVARAEAVKAKRVDPDEDNFLKITTDGRHAALDMRLVDSGAEDNSGSKLNLAIDDIYETWKSETKNRGAQLVFSDLSAPGSSPDKRGGLHGFNVYDEVRRKLIAKGVPAKEIRFIHEANTDEKKARLMADVRSGRVRILLGSTEKMGAGMNVQDRLVKLHHLDAPWRPSDIEQRNGRILRQGNRLFDAGQIPNVGINAYVTEGSFDAYIWQTLERKGEFISQAMKGDVTMRELEELGTVEVDYATAKAIASGNPKVMEKAKLDIEIARLRRLEAAHRDSQFQVRREIKELPAVVEQERKLATETAEDVKRVEDTSGDKFSIVMSGKTYSDRGDAGNILSAIIQKAWIETPTDSAHSYHRRVGTFAGFDFDVEARRRYGGQAEVWMGLHGTTDQWETVSPNDSPKSLIATLEHMPKRFAQQAEKRQANADRSEKRLEQLKEKGEKPFEHAAKLKTAIEQVAVIDRELQEAATKAEKEAVEASKPRAEEGDSDDSTVYAVGDPFTATFLLARRVLKGLKKPGASADPLVTASLPEIEARWQANRGVQAESIRAKAKEAIDALKKLTRHFPEIDTSAGPLEATVHELLLDHERAPKWAQAVAYDELARITEGLKPEEVDLMTRLLVLPDILKDADAGLYKGAKELPFGYANKAQVKADLARFEQEVEKHPAVKRALEARAAFVSKLTRDLVTADLLPSRVLDDSRYFHRQVMAYVNAEKPAAVGVSKGREVRNRLRGFQKERVGGGDFNTRYEQAEYEWVAQALTELKTKAALVQLKALADRTADLKAQVRGINEARLGEVIARKIAAEDGLAEDEANVFAEMEGPHIAKETLKPYAQRVAMGTSQVLGAIVDAHSGETPLEVKGFEDLIETLGERFGRWQDKVKEARENGEPKPPRNFSANHPQWWSFLSALVSNGGPGSAGAAMIFKAIRGREQFMEAQLGRDYVDRKNAEDLLSLAPEGYVAWQPEVGNHFFKVHSIDERAMQEALAGEPVTAAQVRDVVAMGAPKETWIVPDWLAATMNRFGVEPNAQGPLGALDRTVQRMTGLWKQYILSAPQRLLKYNLNNFSGDSDAAMAYGPGIFRHVPDAARDLRHYAFKRSAPEGTTRKDLEKEMERLVELGVIDAGITATEIPDVNDLPAFRRLAEDEPRTFMRAMLALGPKYFARARELTQYRENILRLAAYRYFEAKLKSGATNILAASRPERIEAVRGQRDRHAALLARDLIGDYGAVSAFTSIVRKRTFPFLSFQEVNFKRYVNLFRNVLREEAATSEKAGRVARLTGIGAGRASLAFAKRAALVNMMFIAVALWNHLFFPDEEEELRRRGRNQMHLILGRNEDGSIQSVRIEGAFADFLEWAGLQDYIEDVHDVLKADADIADKAVDAVRAPINKVVQLWEPFTKAIYESITKRSTFPDVFRTTPVRDRTEHAFRIVALDRLYNRVTGKPVPPGNPVARLIAYRTDPGEAAYFDAREKVAKWLDEHGKPRMTGGDATDRANALYYWKRAVQWGDEKAAAKWLKRYKELGGTSRGIDQSLRMGEPLGALNKRDQRGYRRSLKADDRAILDMAEKWYNRVYRGRGKTDMRLVKPPAPIESAPKRAIPAPLRLQMPGGV